MSEEKRKRALQIAKSIQIEAQARVESKKIQRETQRETQKAIILSLSEENQLLEPSIEEVREEIKEKIKEEGYITFYAQNLARTIFPQGSEISYRSYRSGKSTLKGKTLSGSYAAVFFEDKRVSPYNVEPFNSAYNAEKIFLLEKKGDAKFVENRESISPLWTDGIPVDFLQNIIISFLLLKTGMTVSNSNGEIKFEGDGIVLIFPSRVFFDTPLPQFVCEFSLEAISEFIRISGLLDALEQFEYILFPRTMRICLGETPQKKYISFEEYEPRKKYISFEEYEALPYLTYHEDGCGVKKVKIKEAEEQRLSFISEIKTPKIKRINNPFYDIKVGKFPLDLLSVVKRKISIDVSNEFEFKFDLLGLKMQGDMIPCISSPPMIETVLEIDRRTLDVFCQIAKAVLEGNLDNDEGDEIEYCEISISSSTQNGMKISMTNGAKLFMEFFMSAEKFIPKNSLLEVPSEDINSIEAVLNVASNIKETSPSGKELAELILEILSAFKRSESDFDQARITAGLVIAIAQQNKNVSKKDLMKFLGE